MTNMKSALFALATGLLASALASSSTHAQMSKAAAGWEPGQPYLLSVSTASGVHLAVVAVGTIPLEAEARVAMFLPDLTGPDGEQELVYTLSIAGGDNPSSTVLGKPQYVAGRVHKEGIIQSPAGAVLGQGSGSLGSSGGGYTAGYLVIGSDGMQYVPEHDLSDDIVWNDPCVFGGHPLSGAAILGDGDAVELTLGDGAGSLTAGTELAASSQGL